MRSMGHPVDGLIRFVANEIDRGAIKVERQVRALDRDANRVRPEGRQTRASRVSHRGIDDTVGSRRA